LLKGGWEERRQKGAKAEVNRGGILCFSGGGFWRVINGGGRLVNHNCGPKRKNTAARGSRKKK